MVQFTGLVTMLMVTLMYGGELGRDTVLKYWGVFVLVVAANAYVLHVPMIASLVQWGVAAAMYLRARFNPTLD